MVRGYKSSFTAEIDSSQGISTCNARKNPLLQKNRQSADAWVLKVVLCTLLRKFLQIKEGDG
jgi:hypothetical protein